MSSLLLVASAILLLTGLATLIPHQSRMVSDLGYDCLCPFAPYSTITLLLLGGLAWGVRSHVKSLPA